MGETVKASIRYEEKCEGGSPYCEWQEIAKDGEYYEERFVKTKIREPGFNPSESDPTES